MGSWSFDMIWLNLKRKVIWSFLLKCKSVSLKIRSIDNVLQIWQTFTVLELKGMSPNLFRNSGSLIGWKMAKKKKSKNGHLGRVMLEMFEVIFWHISLFLFQFVSQRQNYSSETRNFFFEIYEFEPRKTNIFYKAEP